METERSHTKSPIYKRWWYIVLIFISVLCSFINSIKPAIFIFFSIVDCLLIVPILKNVYTKRKLKNKSISAFDIALAFAIIAIYTFVSAIVIAASYIGNDYYANADNIGTTYLMISAGAILISIACAIGGSVSAISRDGIRIFTSPLTYTTESINAELSPSPTAQEPTAAGTDTVKQPPVVPDRFASLVLSKIPFAYTAKASSNVPENTPERTPAAEKAPEASIRTTKQLSKEPHAQISNEQCDLDKIRKMEPDCE